MKQGVRWRLIPRNYAPSPSSCRFRGSKTNYTKLLFIFSHRPLGRSRDYYVYFHACAFYQSLVVSFFCSSIASLIRISSELFGQEFINDCFVEAGKLVSCPEGTLYLNLANSSNFLFLLFARNYDTHTVYTIYNFVYFIDCFYYYVYIRYVHIIIIHIITIRTFGVV